MPLLQIERVTQRFGGLTAVDDVFGHVEEGELVGLIAPNGAGKTTLFNVICGFTPPTSGEVRFAGTRISGLKHWRICRLGSAGRTKIFTEHDGVRQRLGRRAVREGLSTLDAIWRGAEARRPRLWTQNHQVTVAAR